MHAAHSDPNPLYGASFKLFSVTAVSRESRAANRGGGCGAVAHSSKYCLLPTPTNYAVLLQVSLSVCSVVGIDIDIIHVKTQSILQRHPSSSTDRLRLRIVCTSGQSLPQDNQHVTFLIFGICVQNAAVQTAARGFGSSDNIQSHHHPRSRLVKLQIVLNMKASKLLIPAAIITIRGGFFASFCCLFGDSPKLTELAPLNVGGFYSFEPHLTHQT